MNTTLYAKDAKGIIREWSILTTETGLIIEHGTKGGSMQHKTEKVIPKGSRTMEEQIRSRYYSRCNRQFDKGYVETLEEAESQARTNAIGLLRPMLATAAKNVRNIDYTDAFYQHKYDGNRCLVKNQGGDLVAYSRNGKLVKTIGHILTDMVLPEGATIDGELYCHGVKLQTLCSWIKRKQEATLNIQLRVYDVISPNPYHTRLKALGMLKLGSHAHLVETRRVDEKLAQEFFADSLAHGYEGGIVRWGNAGYEDSKRSKSLVKLKTEEDDEFIVVDIIPSVDGWARLECETNEGNSFMVSAPGTMAEKYKTMINMETFLGRLVTVKYAYMTNDGIPFHPVAKCWREKI